MLWKISIVAAAILSVIACTSTTKQRDPQAQSRGTGVIDSSQVNRAPGKSTVNQYVEIALANSLIKLQGNGSVTCEYSISENGMKGYGSSTDEASQRLALQCIKSKCSTQGDEVLAMARELNLDISKAVSQSCETGSDLFRASVVDDCFAEAMSCN